MNAARRPCPAAVVIMEGPETTSPAAKTWGTLVCRVPGSVWIVPLLLIGSPKAPVSGLIPAATTTRSHSRLPPVSSS